MRTIETAVYKFNELSDEAKQRAIECYRNGYEFFDDFVREDAACIAEILGIDLLTRPVKLMGGSTRYDPCIYYSGFWSQGDGACFEGAYRYKKGALQKLKAHIGNQSKGDKELLRIAETLQRIQSKYFYKLTATMEHRGHYYHSGCMRVNVEHADDTYREIPEDEITQCMRDFADWIYDQLENEYEYQNSDKAITESIIANEYEFNEEGEIV